MASEGVRTVPYFDGVAGRVYYKAWRSEPPVKAQIVFLHGFGEHSGLYHRLGNTLNQSGIDLWALDEIGHGLSDGERAVIRSVDDLVENGRRLTHLAQAANPDISLFLAGHSLGSVAAAVTASRDSTAFAGLVLSGSALSPLDWLTDLGAGDELALDASQLSADPFYLDELAHDPLAFTSAPGAGALISILPAAWEELARDFLVVDVPVLFVHGRDDVIAPVADARAWADRLRNAAIVEFPDSHHDVLNETVHREVARAISDFVLSTARQTSHA